MRKQTRSLRSFTRAPYREQVTFYEWDRRRQAVGAEISAGGVFLRTPEPLDVGALLTLRLPIPGEHAYTILGRVVRAIRPSLGSLAWAGMGVEFVDIPAEARRAIESFVEARNLALCA